MDSIAHNVDDVRYSDPFELDRPLILQFERNHFAKTVPSFADHAPATQMAIQLVSHNTILVSSRLSQHGQQIPTRKNLDS